MSRIASATEFKSFCSRSNCSESRRFRSTISPCNLRSPEICTVMYAEYATTAASVMISPNKSARVGDLCSSDRRVPRWFEPVFSTPKEYPRAPIDMECGPSAPPLQRNPHHHTRRFAAICLHDCSSCAPRPTNPLAHNICNPRLRKIVTSTTITQTPVSGTRNPIGKLFVLVETNPTSHGIADPPSDAIEKTTPPNRRAAGPYHCENHEM